MGAENEVRITDCTAFEQIDFFQDMILKQIQFLLFKLSNCPAIEEPTGHLFHKPQLGLNSIRMYLVAWLPATGDHYFNFTSLLKERLTLNHSKGKTTFPTQKELMPPSLNEATDF